MCRFISFGLLYSALALTASINAGDKKKALDVAVDPEHQILAKLVGTFDARVKFYFDPKKPAESKGTMVRKMILGGKYLQEDFHGEFFEKPFVGLGIMGFDGNQNKYVATWFDSMSTAPLMLQGTYNPAKKTFTMLGDDIEPTSKKKMKARDVLRIVGDDEHQFEMYRQMDGEDKEFRVMEILYLRKSRNEKK